MIHAYNTQFSRKHDTIHIYPKTLPYTHRVSYRALKVDVMCNGCMPVRAVCKPHSPDLKRGALAAVAFGVPC